MADLHDNLPQRQYHSTKAAYVLPNEYVGSTMPLLLPAQENKNADTVRTVLSNNSVSMHKPRLSSR